jgi:putative transposase
MAVEPETYEVIGRPFITVALDIRTRMYCSVYLTFDPPSISSVAGCVVHAVMDKQEWLSARGLSSRWPVAGLPETIHVDNGKEFHSKAFTRACEDYGINLTYRPPATPASAESAIFHRNFICFQALLFRTSRREAFTTQPAMPV